MEKETMKTRLISYTIPASLEAGETIEELIAYCARVSNPKNQKNHYSDEKLITYLIRNKHWSPLEMASVCVEVETTRDIARQMLRHRFSFQEFSQRYADVRQLADNPFVLREARMQDHSNRQSSIETDDEALMDQWEDLQIDIAQRTTDAYEWAIGAGIAKEQARCVLPEGMTTSRLYMNGNIRQWLHYLALRTEAGTQKEHREVAMACANVIEPVFHIKKYLNF